MWKIMTACVHIPLFPVSKIGITSHPWLTTRPDRLPFAKSQTPKSFKCLSTFCHAQPCSQRPPQPAVLLAFHACRLSPFSCTTPSFTQNIFPQTVWWFTRPVFTSLATFQPPIRGVGGTWALAHFIKYLYDMYICVQSYVYGKKWAARLCWIYFPTFEWPREFCGIAITEIAHFITFLNTSMCQRVKMCTSDHIGTSFKGVFQVRYLDAFCFRGILFLRSLNSLWIDPSVWFFSCMAIDFISNL